MIPKDYKGHNIVFIVGSPRSGTTWLQRLLSSHPRVRTGQESGLFDSYIGPQLRAWKRDMDPSTSGRSAIGLGCYFQEQEFLGLLKGYMLSLLEPMVGDLPAGAQFVEKTPSHALFIPEIMELLPESRIIHILRDARDVAASLIAASKSWGSYWAPNTARRAARMWVEHVVAARDAAKKIAPGQFLEVRYEDLHAYPADVLKNVMEFLRLPWERGAIEAVIKNNTVTTAKATGGAPITVGGEYAKRGAGVLVEPQDFVRKGRPKSWRKDLTAKERFWVWFVARTTMAEVGYQWSLPW